MNSQIGKECKQERKGRAGVRGKGIVRRRRGMRKSMHDDGEERGGRRKSREKGEGMEQGVIKHGGGGAKGEREEKGGGERGGEGGRAGRGMKSREGARGTD